MMKQLIGLLLVTVFAITGCGSAPSVPAISPAAPTIPASATARIDVTSYPSVQAPQVNENQLAGGYTVNLERAWREGKAVYADVCYSLPDASDWTIWDAHFEYGGQAVSEFSLSMLSTEAAAGAEPGRRCDELAFYVPPDADLSSAALTIESLGAPPGPGEYCSLYMPKIQQSLDERGVAITLTCGEVGGSMIMKIAGKPDGMTDEEAQQIVFSDEFYTVMGPWIFPISLGQ